jgi:hypothetical protein
VLVLSGYAKFKDLDLANGATVRLTGAAFQHRIVSFRAAVCTLH